MRAAVRHSSLCQPACHAEYGPPIGTNKGITKIRRQYVNMCDFFIVFNLVQISFMTVLIGYHPSYIISRL